MALIVQKFGGTSVGTVEKINHAADRVIEEKKKGNDCVVVVSAMGQTTDQLIQLAKEISSKPPERELDMLLATGEQVAGALFAMALQNKGYAAVSLTGWQAGIQTEAVFGKARIMH
ncbi:MAG: aspartate kinase, partial [Bacillales bacterium]